MIKRIAALSCGLSLLQCSVFAADDAMKARPAAITAAVLTAAPQAGPLRKASLSKETQTILRAETRWAARPIQNDGSDRGSWMERHPVWTGAMVGFGAGFLITYAALHNDRPGIIQLMRPVDGAGIGGCFSAGVGALVGWGIGRNRDDHGYHDRGGSGSTTGRQ